jgi:DNA-3-methyladenine glycosylase
MGRVLRHSSLRTDNVGAVNPTKGATTSSRSRTGRTLPKLVVNSRNLCPKLRVLPRAFFNRDPRELMGKLLVRKEGRTLLAGRIVEAEAYLGLTDPGSHAYRGWTARNAVLFGPPGHAYVYFIYGNHYCTNVSCQREGDPGCVLLRALEPVCGLAEMAALRNLTPAAGRRGAALPDPAPAAGSSALPDFRSRRATELRQLTSGPGRLSQALHITRPADNGKDLCSAASDLFIGSDDAPAPEVTASPRVNVTRAPHDLWRFTITGNPFVSLPRP